MDLPLPTSVLVTIDATGAELVRSLPTTAAAATCTYQRTPGGPDAPAVLIGWEIPGVVGEGQLLLTPEQADQLGTQLIQFAMTHRVG